VHLLKVIRDVAIIVILTGIAGAAMQGILGTTAPAGAVRAIALSNLIFGTIGFVISGALARRNRWAHLAWVGLGVWLAGLINVFLSGVPIAQWLVSIFVVAVMMGVGGGLSYLFRNLFD
jgi:hypothetical protein